MKFLKNRDYMMKNVQSGQRKKYKIIKKISLCNCMCKTKQPKSKMLTLELVHIKSKEEVMKKNSGNC